MSTGRFEVDEGDKGLMIYDQEGVDDYYFVNDKKELQEFCNLVNEQEEKILGLQQTIIQFEILSKQMNLQLGSIAAMTMKALDYPDILYITKDEEEPGTAKIYVKTGYDPILLKAFMKSTVPLGIKCKFVVVSDVKVEEIKEMYPFD